MEEKKLRGGTKHTRSATTKAHTRTGISGGEPETIGTIKYKLNKKEEAGRGWEGENYLQSLWKVVEKGVCQHTHEEVPPNFGKSGLLIC